MAVSCLRLAQVALPRAIERIAGGAPTGDATAEVCHLLTACLEQLLRGQSRAAAGMAHQHQWPLSRELPHTNLEFR